jgi:Protein of unknown function (DUF4199)
MNKLTPLIKGLITGVLMVAISLWLYQSKTAADSALGYLIYTLYAAGIAWTLIGYARSAGYTGKFGDIFGQGFRCFVVVTLIMVVYTVVFTKMHPEMAEESAKMHKEALVKEKNKTPDEIEKLVAEGKSGFTTSYVSITIFSTLIVGAIFTGAGAGLLIMRRK